MKEIRSFRRKKSVLRLLSIKCVEQIELQTLLLTCTPIFELPSKIRTMHISHRDGTQIYMSRYYWKYFILLRLSTIPCIFLLFLSPPSHFLFFCTFLSLSLSLYFSLSGSLSLCFSLAHWITLHCPLAFVKNSRTSQNLQLYDIRIMTICKKAWKLNIHKQIVT